MAKPTQRTKYVKDLHITAGIFVASGWLKDQGWPTLAEQMERALIRRRKKPAAPTRRIK